MSIENSSHPLTIGKVARQVGLGVETIRFYERENLLPVAHRDPSSGYRRYTSETVLRLQFIARAKELGFTLREIRELLELRSSNRGSCKSVRSKAEEKLQHVRQKIQHLQHIEKALLTLTKTCPGTDDLIECPILSALEHGE